MKTSGVPCRFSWAVMRSVGIDLGSVETKAAFLEGSGGLCSSLLRRRDSGDLPALQSFLSGCGPDDPSGAVALGVIGEASKDTDGRLCGVNGILALAAWARARHPAVRSVVEIGGHTSKFLVLDTLGEVRDFATNEACAAGTGAFLDQQARRLGLAPADLSALAISAPRAATIAGRCTVFAASDMLHLQQKGTPLPEIAYGLCVAIARNFLATLLKGRELEPPLALAGGCARSLGIVRAFHEVLGLSENDLLVSEQPGLEGAIGAALEAEASGVVSIEIPLARKEIERLLTSRQQTRPRLPRLRVPVAVSQPEEPEGDAAGPVTGYLGIDAGSVSTDLVVLDEQGEVRAAIYLATRGRPAEVTLEGLSTLSTRFGGRLKILACGVTGSARHLAGKLASADVIKNEITCQLLGTRQYLPGVDTIFEIGGQDSKFISVLNGRIADFAMNKVCAAGTGSFLEEQARDLGIDVCSEFSPRAFEAAGPPDLGCRCTVFMETEVSSALSTGAGLPEIAAGLAYAIARNYLERVVSTRPLGKAIVFQGGVASNAAVVAAFESILGRPVKVHPYNRISGAIGAALAAREARLSKGEGFASRFAGFAPVEKLELRSFECHLCANRCEVNIVQLGKGSHDRAFFGDTCERYTCGGVAAHSALPNLAEEYIAAVERLFQPTGEEGLSIGVPRASALIGNLAFWVTFWKELGHRPVLSKPSSQRTLASGLRHLSVGVCLPIKLTSGHVQELLDEGVDRVFVPAVCSLPGEEPSFTCPCTMAVPFIVGSGTPDRFIAPVVRFDGERAFAAGFEPWLDVLGVSRDRLKEAFRAAAWVQQEVDEMFRRRAVEAVTSAEESPAFAVLGRPYNLFDSYMNLGLFERLRRLGILAVPQPFLPVAEPPERKRPPLPWRYPASMEDAALWLRGEPRFSPVIVSSFGCGPDAFALRRIEGDLHGRPHLVLEFDEHRGEAGLITRLEAFVDQLGESHRAQSGQDLPPARSAAFIPETPSRVRIPYFADHAFAFSGLFRLAGHDAKVLPLPDSRVRALGEKHSLGKECHAYSMLLGDLLRLAEEHETSSETVFYFPGTSIPCLLHEYGNGMEFLLRDLAISGLRVSSPNGEQLIRTFGIEAMDRFYVGLLAIELLVKAVCQLRPYELEKGATDEVHWRNLERIEAAIAGGDVFVALKECLRTLGEIPAKLARDRPVVGIAGDIYTRVNPAANADLVRWLEDRGLEVWPSPFQIDIVDLGISRGLYQSVAELDFPGLLVHGSLALRRAVDLWRVRTVVGSRVTRREEPGYLELKKLAAPYMPNEAHELLFTNVAKIVDFARNGADGIINAICFGCMVGNASAAVIERIRRDHGDIPIITAVYSGIEDPSRRMVLEAFVSQVKAHHRRHASPRSLAGRLRLLGESANKIWAARESGG